MGAETKWLTQALKHTKRVWNIGLESLKYSPINSIKPLRKIFCRPYHKSLTLMIQHFKKTPFRTSFAGFIRKYLLSFKLFIFNDIVCHLPISSIFWFLISCTYAGQLCLLLQKFQNWFFFKYSPKHQQS